MINRNRINSYSFVLFIILAAFLAAVTGTELFAQQPTHIPDPKAEPVQFFESWGNVILYIVLPVIVIVFYVIWRRRNHKARRKQQEEAARKRKESRE